MRFIILTAFVALLAVAACAVAPVTLTCTVDGVARTALVYPGAQATVEAAPLVLAFHGLGGTSRQLARSSRLHEAWPQATVVYPQGLTVQSTLLQRKGTGWESPVGDTGQRDIRFVDALLTALSAQYKVDARRVYATGMSNGGAFTYTLLAERPLRFAAYAPVAAASARLRTATVPRPILIIHGEKDTIVPLAWAERTRDQARALNQCGAETVAWQPGYLRYQPCATGMPVIWHQHPGGHSWPADASTQIVRFFKEQSLP